MTDLAYSPKISKKQIGFRFMKEYHNVLYAVYTNALLGIALFCYFDEIYVPLETNGVHMRSSYQKLNLAHRKTNVGQKALSYVGPSLWNNLSKALKISTSINALKYNIKQYYFYE